MKKTTEAVIVLAILVSFAHPAQAQIDVGIRGGLNFATFNDSNFDVGTRTGLLLGVYVNIPLTNSQFSVQPEILYSQKGYEKNDLRTEIAYIEVPVLVKFTLLPDRLVSPSLYFGPYMAFKVHVGQERRPPIIYYDIIYYDFVFPPFIEKTR